MRAFLPIALFGALLVVGAFGAQQCSDALVEEYKKNKEEFGVRMTACLAEDAEDDCCLQVQGLFSEGGALELCLCDSDFYTMVLETVPAAGVTADEMVEMWEECEVPILGSDVCGPSEEKEPKVKAQILFKKKLFKKALIASMLHSPSPAPKPPAPVVRPVVVAPAKKTPKVHHG